ncbi:MAG: hypothetical protein R6X16_00995 [Anaerolineae bacterium]
MGKLYVVGPLGDVWRDVPLRALHVLQESSFIVAHNVESVREWLLQGEICTPLLDVCDNEMIPLLLEALRSRDVAWLVQALADLEGSARSALARLIEHGIEPISVPGPSHVISGLSVSGLSTDRFTFLGSPALRSSERRSLLEAVADEPATVACEVTAEQLPDVLGDVLASLGDRRMTIHGRRFVWRGQAVQAGRWPGEGWLALIIEGAGQDRAWTRTQVDAEISRLLNAGVSSREVARGVARRSGWPRRQVYQMAIALCGEG